MLWIFLGPGKFQNPLKYEWAWLYNPDVVKSKVNFQVHRESLTLHQSKQDLIDFFYAEFLENEK